MPVVCVAIVFDQGFIQRLEEGQQLLQAAGDRTRRQVQAQAAEFRQNAIERLKESKFVLQNHDPDRDPQEALGNDLGWWRGRDHGRLAGAASGAGIAVAVIDTAVGTDFDFEDLAVVAAGELLPGRTTVLAALLVGRHFEGLVRGRQMVIGSACWPFGTTLLSA